MPIARIATFRFQASSIDAVVLSHAHIDHSGNLPSLVKNGFSGPIYTTPATIDLCNWMLRDTAHIQEKDAEFVNKRLKAQAAGPDNGDRRAAVHHGGCRATLPLFRPVPYHTPSQIWPRTELRELTMPATSWARPASCCTIRPAARRCAWLSRATSGVPICPSSAIPRRMPPADYLIMESTYGGRLHKSVEPRHQQAGGRSQPHRQPRRTHHRAGLRRRPHAAARAAAASAGQREAHSQHPDLRRQPARRERHRRSTATIPECFDEETREYLSNGEDPFGFSRLQYIREAAESKKLNDLHGPFVVISASGMCEQGRILHHLRNNIEDPRNTVLITGFQAADTLGRKLVEKWPEVQDLRRADARARRNREPGRAQRPCRPERVAGVDEAHGSHPEQGLPGARRARAVARLWLNCCSPRIVWKWSVPAPGQILTSFRRETESAPDPIYTVRKM